MERHLRPAPSTSVAAVGDELAVLRSDTGDVLVLNASASRIWKLCDGSRSVSDIVAVLRDRFPGADDLEADVADAVETLLARGFVVDPEAPSTAEPDPLA